jgi:hypothetical protein
MIRISFSVETWIIDWGTTWQGGHHTAQSALDAVCAWIAEHGPAVVEVKR